MTQVLLGKEVPSLKITLENDVDSDPEGFEEGELSEPEIDLLEGKILNDETSKQHVKVTREFSDPFKGIKLYENKGGAFVTGLDLSSESLSKKLEGRANRFGLPKSSENKVTQQEIDALYESMGIDLDSLKSSSSKAKNFRLDSIHMRGVDDMNTKEIFHYFNEYGPASVEWINDYSCNVVWLDETSTARALLGMSQVLIQKKETAVTEDSRKNVASLHDKTDTAKSSLRDEVVLMSDDSLSDEDSFDRLMEKHIAANASSISMEVDKSEEIDKSDEIDNSEKVDKPEETNKFATQDPSSIDVPIPPGHWRIGLPHPKSKALLLRFATKDDKKIRGAEKRSHFYQKYGNPNYGGLKGLISTSRKRKMQATRTRQVVESLKEEPKPYAAIINAGVGSGDEASAVFTSNKQQSKPNVRMRMYADDEEEKRDTKRFKSEEIRSTTKRGSVHSRLGKKFTTVQLRNLEKDISSDDDNSELQITREIKVPSRYSIWTSLAKSMAEEDGMAGSRQHRKAPEDLRDSLSSSRSSSRVSKPERRLPRKNEDLRSRIKEIREDSFSSHKHRSPLLLPDRMDSESD